MYRDRWRDAIERLHATNNFPEFTGRLCPAPCEAACVLGINQDPVTIKQVEVEIIDRAWAEGWVAPVAPTAADRQAGGGGRLGPGRAGRRPAAHPGRPRASCVFERADRIGGLLRYGIPEFKMEKRHLDRRLAQMEAEGTELPGRRWTSASTSPPTTCGPTSTPSSWPAAPPRPATCRSPGGELGGIHQAMEYLPIGQPGAAGRPAGADDHGQGQARRDHRRRRHRRRLPGHRPPPGRGVDPPVRDHAPAARRPARLHAVAHLAAHVPHVLGPRGGRRAGVLGQHRVLPGRRATARVRAPARPRGRDGRRPLREGRGHRLRAAVRARAAGHGLRRPRDERRCSRGSASSSTERGNVGRDDGWATNVDGVFVAGDMGRGQSLIVWAIAEGRSCAAAVDRWLEGETLLPAPIVPTDRPAGASPERERRAPPGGGALECRSVIRSAGLDDDRLGDLVAEGLLLRIPEREQRVDQHEQPAAAQAADRRRRTAGCGRGPGCRRSAGRLVSPTRRSPDCLMPML